MSSQGKVLFIVHDVYQEDNEFPLGIGYLAAVLKKHGADVTVCCQDVFHYSNEELAEKYLKNKTYDLIGIGFMAARFKETILDLCKTVNKHKKNAKLILGGHGPSSIPEYVLKTTQADLVAIGEAEETIIEVLDTILLKKDFSQIKGIAYRDGDNVFVNGRRKPVKNLDSLPFPAWELFPMDKYTTNMKYMGQAEDQKAMQVLTSRGCVNKCTFCYRLEKGFRFRSMENVMQEIKALYDTYNVTYFTIQDELFVASVKRFKEYLAGLEKYGLLHNIKYNISVGIRADIANDEMAKLLKESGCQKVNIGFESTSQICLDDYKKNTTVEDNIRTAELMKRNNMNMGVNFIFGAPHDTEETLKQNVQFIKKYNQYQELRTIRPVTPYPGSEMFDYAVEKGLLTGPEEFFERFKNSDLITVNFTEIPNDKFYKMLFEANKELILDHFQHTNGDMKEAQHMIDSFYNLYFKGFTKFRGARHFEKKSN
jgi:anaerobic magnesium-protoporphyrin IX monomethyl ester cyclase